MSWAEGLGSWSSWDASHLPLIGLDTRWYKGEDVKCQGQVCAGRAPTEDYCPIYDCDYGRGSREVDPGPKLNSTQRYKRHIQRFRAKQEKQWDAMDHFFRNTVKEEKPSFKPTYIGLEGWTTQDERNAEVKAAEDAITGSQPKEKCGKTRETTSANKQTNSRIVTPKKTQLETQAERQLEKCVNKQKHFPKFCLLPNVQLSKETQREEKEKILKEEELRRSKEDQQYKSNCLRTPISDDCKDAPWSTQFLKRREQHITALYTQHMQHKVSTEHSTAAAQHISAQQQATAQHGVSTHDWECSPMHKGPDHTTAPYCSTAPGGTSGHQRMMWRRGQCCVPVWEDRILPRNVNKYKTDSSMYYNTQRCMGAGHGRHRHNMMTANGPPEEDIGHGASQHHGYDAYSRRLRPQKRHIDCIDNLW